MQKICSIYSKCRVKFEDVKFLLLYVSIFCYSNGILLSWGWRPPHRWPCACDCMVAAGDFCLRKAPEHLNRDYTLVGTLVGPLKVLYLVILTKTSGHKTERLANTVIYSSKIAKTQSINQSIKYSVASFPTGYAPEDAWDKH